MFVKLKKDTSVIYLGFLLLLCFSIFMYSINKIYGFVIFPDEFGYWSSAAHLLGYDWSEITSLGSYYSFGYSLILSPILWLIEDATVAYRIAVGVNACFMCAAIGLMCGMLNKIFPDKKKNVRILIGGIAVFYPAWIFYMQMTLTEAMLLFLFILICRLMLSMLENPKAGTAAGLAVTLVYIYFLHMRSVGIVLVAVVTLLIYSYLYPRSRKKIFLLCVILGLAMAVGLYTKKIISNSLYQAVDAEFLKVNDYGGQWKKFKTFVTLSGIRDLFISSIGKALYLGISTFGIFYWGVWHAVKQVMTAVRKAKVGNRSGSAGLFWGFVLAAGGLQVMISAVYTLGSERIDHIIHGRYNELIIPFFIAIGVIQIMESDRKWLGSCFLIALEGIACLILVCVIRKNEMINIHGYFMVGMSYMLNENHFEPSIFLWKAWILSSVLSVCMVALLMIFQRKNAAEWFLSVLLVLHIGLGIQAGGHYIYKSNQYGYGDMQVADKLQELAPEPDRNIVHLYEGGMQYIELVQFRLRDRKIEVLSGIEIETYIDKPAREDFVIVDTESPYREKLDALYEMSWEPGHLCLYYNL